MITFAQPRFRYFAVLCLVIVAALFAAQALAASPARADANPEYDSIPDPYPPSLLSVGFAATSTSEFGDDIQLAGTDRILDNVTVGLTNWACESDFTLAGNTWTATGATCTTTPGATYSHPITLNIYGVDSSGGADPVIATLTQDVAIPFRPSANPGTGPGLCGTGADGTRWYNPATDTCQNGFAFNVVFDFSATRPTLPDEVVMAVAFNTQNSGASPIGANGPYNSLNVSLAGDAPITGTDVNEDVVMWNTSHGPFYTDGGASGVGTLRADTGWNGYGGLVLAINASAAPVPAVAPPVTSTGGSTGTATSDLPTLALPVATTEESGESEASDPPTVAQPDAPETVPAVVAETEGADPLFVVVGVLVLVLGTGLILLLIWRMRRSVKQQH